MYCERKGPVGKSLHFDTSWSKYLILKKSREKQKREAAMKAPTGPFTDEERDQYKKEIINLQAYIIGNVTQVLTCQQVQVLSGKKVICDSQQVRSFCMFVEYMPLNFFPSPPRIIVWLLISPLCCSGKRKSWEGESHQRIYSWNLRMKKELLPGTNGKSIVLPLRR